MDILDFYKGMMELLEKYKGLILNAEFVRTPELDFQDNVRIHFQSLSRRHFVFVLKEERPLEENTNV